MSDIIELCEQAGVNKTGTTVAFVLDQMARQSANASNYYAESLERRIGELENENQDLRDELDGIHARLRWITYGSVRRES